MLPILLTVLFLIALSALFSGLTLGLMGLSLHDLKRKADVGDRNAARVLTVRRRGNLLLTTLLIGNVAVNAVLSLFLGSLTGGVVAGLAATGLIVVFGEILPQAIFSRYALALGARLVPLVRVLIIALYPVSAPIAWVLDRVLGEELPTIYSKRELMKLIEDHEDARESDLDADEERILKGALTFSDKRVADVMTPRAVVAQYAADQVVDTDFILHVKRSGFSRFPVWEGAPGRVIGMLHAVDLVGIAGDGTRRVRDLPLHPPEFIEEMESLDNTLERFLRTQRHLFAVRGREGVMSGVISLEDILEEILRKEIVDERDRHTDLRALARRRQDERANVTQGA